MFWNILKARMTIQIREKNFVFWGIIFPVFLSTFLFIGTLSKPTLLKDIDHFEPVMEGNTQIVNTYLDLDGNLSDIIFFLGILAIACIISGFSGCREMEDYSYFVSSKAIRVQTAPISSSLFFICGLCATWGLAFMYLVILFTYFKFVLGIRLVGPLIGWILLFGLSTLCGCLIGMFTGLCSKQSIPIKQGEIAIFGVGGCILAGLINDDMKFYVDAYLPIISKINPTSIMVEAMFTLCLHGMTEHFMECIMSLCIWNVVGLLGVIFLIYRRKMI